MRPPTPAGMLVQRLRFGLLGSWPPRADCGSLILAQLLFLGAGGHLRQRRLRIVEVPVLEGEGEARRAGCRPGRRSAGPGPAARSSQSQACCDGWSGSLRLATIALWSSVGRRASAASFSTNARSSLIWPVACVIWMKPSSRSRSTRARLRMSSSHIVSVTIGEPSKSAWLGVVPQALDREAAQAGVHALVQQALHLGALGLGGGAGLGRFEAHHVGHQRRGRHVLDAVHALGRALEGVEVLGDGLPVPRSAPRFIDS